MQGSSEPAGIKASAHKKKESAGSRASAHQKPRVRELVLIAVMAALTVCISLAFYVTVPIKAGSAMVIIAGIVLGPEAGFLVGALARFVLNFYQGQGAWTPWQMISWGLLGFLAGLCFEHAGVRNYYEELEEQDKPKKTARMMDFLAPVIAMAVAFLAACLSYLIAPMGEESLLGWRLYLFGAMGLLGGALVQKKKLPVNSVSISLFGFFTIFILYGGIMNLCALVTSAAMAGMEPVSFSSLRAVYLTGVLYDAAHAASAALFLFLFGQRMIQRLERVKVKYGIFTR